MVSENLPDLKHMTLRAPLKLYLKLYLKKVDFSISLVGPRGLGGVMPEGLCCKNYKLSDAQAS